MKTAIISIVLIFGVLQVFSAPCSHQLNQFTADIEKEKNLIGDIAAAREALREYRSTLSSLGKQVASSIMVITKDTYASLSEMIANLKQQGLTPEEEANLQQFIKQAKININEIVKINFQDLKVIRMSVAEILDDLIYDHSAIPADVEKLNANLKMFQENVVSSTKKIRNEIMIVQTELVKIMNAHAQEMTLTILEGMEKIRKSLVEEYKEVKDELSEVRMAEAVVIEAVKKVLSHFDPTAHNTIKPTSATTFSSITMAP